VPVEIETSTLALAPRDRQTRVMGLKELWQRWSKGEDARAVERAEEESRMSASERAADHEDFEARKDDIEASRGPAGSAATDVASEDL
jgi:hypothetical protein